MFVKLNESVTVRRRDICGVFDLDGNVTTAVTRDFLKKAQQQGVLTDAGAELPKSYVVVRRADKCEVILSPYASQIIVRR